MSPRPLLPSELLRRATRTFAIDEHPREPAVADSAIKLPDQEMSFDEWLEWASRQDTGRFELFDGKVYMMSPEMVGHARARLRVCNAFQAAIQSKGAHCEAFVDGPTIRIDDRKGFEPDVVVNCGPPIPETELVAPSPVVLVEILSPGSRRFDTRIKLTEYFKLPSVQHYLIGALEQRTVVHHWRGATGRIETQIVSSGLIQLDPPGIAIDVAAFFPQLP